MSSNPVPTHPGPDFHVRSFLHQAFESHAQKGSVFDLNDWSKWSEAEVAGVIRALSHDFLDAHGKGYDWLEAALQAEFVMAGTYHEVAHDAGLSPAPPMNVNFFDPEMGEGIEILMEPPSRMKMDPIPGATIPATPANPNTVRSRSRLLVAPPGNCLEVSDGSLKSGAEQLAEFFVSHSRLSLIMMGACLTIWKGLQVAHTARAGIIFRGIRNTVRPEIPEGEMRLVYARTGPHMIEASQEDPDGASLFLV